AGSDDHVHRRCGSVYTEVDGGGLTPASFVAACMAGEGRPVGRQAHLDAMALCVKHTTYHHLKSRQAERADFRNPFVEMMDFIAGRDPAGPCVPGAPRNGFLDALLEGAGRASLCVGEPLD